VLAALLAEKGYTGDRAILDGDLGLWKFLGSVDVDWDLLVGELGKKWWILEDSIKPYPCCRFLNSGLDLFYKTIREQEIGPEEIESVTFRLNPVAMGSRLGKPYMTLDPTDAEAPFNLQFSAPYVITMAALGITPGPDWYAPARSLDPRVSEFMKKVKVEANHEAFEEVLRAVREEPTKRFKKCPNSVTVVAKGKAFDAYADYAIGDPWAAEMRMSDDQLKEKFRNFCHNIISSTKIEKAIELIYELDKLDNVAELGELLTTDN
jgi:2-methylcitrate dehydratase PrpD